MGGVGVGLIITVIGLTIMGVSIQIELDKKIDDLPGEKILTVDNNHQIVTGHMVGAKWECGEQELKVLAIRPISDVRPESQEKIKNIYCGGKK